MRRDRERLTAHFRRHATRPRSTTNAQIVANTTYYHVNNGCLGIFNDGDPAGLSTAYTVTPKQAVTSP